MSTREDWIPQELNAGKESPSRLTEFIQLIRAWSLSLSKCGR